MDITNIENEWKDLKNNKKRQADLNNILKDLDAVPEPRAKGASAKDQVKRIVKSILDDKPEPQPSQSNGECPFECGDSNRPRSNSQEAGSESQSKEERESQKPPKQE